MKDLENFVKKKTKLAMCIATLSTAAIINAADAQVTVYQHCNYGGWSESLTTGNHEFTSTTNNNISSVRVDPGYQVTLYENANQSGRSVSITDDTSCLVGLNFNDLTTSMEITEVSNTGSVTLYQHCNFQGYAVSIDPGDYTLSDLANLGVLNDDVSSIRVDEGMKATLFQYDNFTGTSISVTEQDDCLVDNNANGLSFNDVLTSIKVEVDDDGDSGGNDDIVVVGDCTLNDDEVALIEAHNDARSEGRWCGSEFFDAAPALRWDCRLGAAAQKHSDDMANNDFFSHVGSSGSSFVDRINAEGYQWRGAAENISAGNGDAASAVQGWLNSEGHCRNIMNAGYEDMGGGVARNSNSTYGIYWTTDFGSTF